MAFCRTKRGGGKTFYARFKDNTGTWQEERLDCTSIREAKRIEAERKRSVADGSYRKGRIATDALTLEAYAAEWLRGRRNKTKRDDEQRLRDYVFPELGKRRLREMRPIDCITFVSKLVSRGVNPKTVSNIWGALRTLLRDASIAELVSFQPIMPRGVIPERQAEIHEIYANHDVLSLMAPSERSGMDLFCAIAFYTGMRQGEICGLRAGDYEPAEGNRLASLVVRRQYLGEGDDSTTKTGRARRVPVHPLLAEVLGGLDGLPKSTPIVQNRSGEHHTKSSSYKAFLRHCEARGVKSLGIHRTRHTAITAMRRGGAPKEVVEQITHNSRGTIVDRYTHDWSILCAGVSVINYGPRGDSRGGLPEISGNMQANPVSIPGASTNAINSNLHPQLGGGSNYPPYN